jgi:hypothetical protein
VPLRGVSSRTGAKKQKKGLITVKKANKAIKKRQCDTNEKLVYIIDLWKKRVLELSEDKK